MLNKLEIVDIEILVVEFYDIFARHRFDSGMNEEFTVKLTHQHIARVYQPQ